MGTVPWAKVAAFVTVVAAAELAVAVVGVVVAGLNATVPAGSVTVHLLHMAGQRPLTWAPSVPSVSHSAGVNTCWQTRASGLPLQEVLVGGMGVATAPAPVLVLAVAAGNVDAVVVAACTVDADAVVARASLVGPGRAPVMKGVVASSVTVLLVDVDVGVATVCLAVAVVVAGVVDGILAAADVPAFRTTVLAGAVVVVGVVVVTRVDVAVVASAEVRVAWLAGGVVAVGTPAGRVPPDVNVGEIAAAPE